MTVWFWISWSLCLCHPPRCDSGLHSQWWVLAISIFRHLRKSKSQSMVSGLSYDGDNQKVSSLSHLLIFHWLSMRGQEIQPVVRQPVFTNIEKRRQLASYPSYFTIFWWLKKTKASFSLILYVHAKELEACSSLLSLFLHLHWKQTVTYFKFCFLNTCIKIQYVQKSAQTKSICSVNFSQSEYTQVTSSKTRKTARPVPWKSSHTPSSYHRLTKNSHDYAETIDRFLLLCNALLMNTLFIASMVDGHYLFLVFDYY